MKSIKISIIVLFLTVCSTALFGQANTSQTQELSLTDGTIDDQFEYVIQKSNRYRDEQGRIYKVVRREWLYTLKSHTLDSLKAVHDELGQANESIDTQANEINELQINLKSTQDTLANTNIEKDSMALFGLQMSKGSYNMLMWTIIIGLLVLLLVFIVKFKKSNATTRASKKALVEIESEFEEHRRIALEREQKVRRQLQDEINKQKGNS
jgi:septal ring factor EnvC (AmiA/AmiB activator)